MPYKDSNKSGCNIYIFFMTKVLCSWRCHNCMFCCFAQQAAIHCKTHSGWTQRVGSYLGQNGGHGVHPGHGEAAEEQALVVGVENAAGKGGDPDEKHHLESLHSSRGGSVSQVSSWHISALPLPSLLSASEATWHWGRNTQHHLTC